ncbi:quinone oxidoreductase family protein [Sphingomonas jatrophae]|uniref:NADPH2:quinone reductase n=1 Tax=Sphingomonas jatrophae TaxID=1166337 RepID=A0A1I6K007_9SPHN|nr:quinone oxidoreductase [Sphingomonas jatrophae]SFR84458.1 NADPH2:quinone reductase [Sphingomonas jatrophae]
MTERVARIARTGGPDVIEWHDVDLPPPGPGEVRLRHKAVGLNFIDTYHRSGLYKVDLPAGLGSEAAGVIEAVGEGVTGFAPGQRVATFGPSRGAYATARNVAAAELVALPDDISDEVAAAALLKGGTAEFLAERCARVEAGWPVLVHAAAGGVGLILVQWLASLGARVIGTVGDQAKVAAARAAGAGHVLLSRDEDIAARVRELTGGEGVRVVFDGVGEATWEASLASAARRGLIVSYGNASGAVTGVALGTLSAHGSLFVTRPTMFDYWREPEERAAAAERLWAMIREGRIKLTIGARYPLEDAAQAHTDLEARRTSGSTLLLP